MFPNTSVTLKGGGREGTGKTGRPDEGGEGIVRWGGGVGLISWVGRLQEEKTQHSKSSMCTGEQGEGNKFAGIQRVVLHWQAVTTFVIG